jgi:DNA repair protein RadA/Sms
MGKVKRMFVCSSCEHPAAQWAGRCPACGDWGTVEERAGMTSLRAVDGGPAPRLATLAFEPEERRLATGLPGLDRILGGGMVRGSSVLVAGAPGIGKSTLLLQLASHMHAAGHSCLIASGEEARHQVASRAQRLGLEGASLSFVPGRDLPEVLQAARTLRPDVLIVDSIQTLRDPMSDALPGGPGQVRLCADALIGVAKEQVMGLFLIGHVTKDGDLAGPRTLEHAVDVVVTFEGEARSGLRVLAGGKNRFGAEGEVAWLRMTGRGLEEAEAGPALGEGSGEPGCATALAMAGRRGLAVEIQALVVPGEGPPRRQAMGLDGRRFHILAAVTERATRVRLSRAELFGAVAGGIRLDDHGADLAVAMALASAGLDLAPPPGVAFVGEVSLTGAVRPVGGMEQRFAAACAAGLDTVVCATGATERTGAAADRGLRVVRAGHLRDAVRWLREAAVMGRRGSPEGAVAS